ncbi:MAG TPA: TIM barrel protein [Chloroflexota bacterium]|jgi:hydroxypyruvate isomerase|nr:TIM barrel protein [Chloroflexota bacterium]
MPTLSVCIEMVFRPLEVVERIEAVARAGYPAFEFWGWQNKDMAAIQEAKERHGLRLAAFGVGGGTLLDPANHQRYWDTLGQAAEWARRLNCPNLIVTTGNTLPEVPREVQLEHLRQGLEGVARAAQAGGVTAVLEPLNSKVDHKGYFLDHGPEAFALVEAIDNPHLRILYDIYHMQIMDGDIIATIEAKVDTIGHFHVADVPGRHEPGTGELNYGNIFRRIDATGYQGFVGLEYRPSGDHAASLEVVKALAA